MIIGLYCNQFDGLGLVGHLAIVSVRVSRTLGDRVTGVAPYVLNLFLLTPYTQSNPMVYCVLKILNRKQRNRERGKRIEKI